MTKREVSRSFAAPQFLSPSLQHADGELKGRGTRWKRRQPVLALVAVPSRALRIRVLPPTLQALALDQEQRHTHTTTAATGKPRERPQTSRSNGNIALAAPHRTLACTSRRLTSTETSMLALFTRFIASFCLITSPHLRFLLPLNCHAQVHDDC